MQPSRLRLVCHTHNRFSPSTILRQHFLEPSQLVSRHGRYSSSTADAAQGRGEAIHTQTSAAPERNTSEQSHAQPQTTRPPKVVIRKIHVRDHIAYPEGVVARSLHKEKHARDQSLARIPKLLDSTKQSCSKTGDYQAALLEPEWDKPCLNDRRLPWTIPLEERPTKAMDRYVHLGLCLTKHCLILRGQAQS